jgi:hypothetical protein
MTTESKSLVSTEQAEKIHTSQKRSSSVKEKSGVSAKRKRICLTTDQKIEICKLKEANPCIKNSDNELASVMALAKQQFQISCKKSSAS